MNEVTSTDKCFADLAKALKRNVTMKGMEFATVAEWYQRYYYMSNKDSFRYIESIRHILVEYMASHGFITVKDILSRLAPSNGLRHKFTDLDDDRNDQYDCRVVAELCGKLLMTAVSDIPGFER